jgi:hypothetical protein
MKINATNVAIVVTAPIWVPAFIVGMVTKVLFIGLKYGFLFIKE